jgi:haloacetate dehalogenase
MNETDDSPDLFPGFAHRTVETQGARIFCRSGGSGPPVVLLHGYPQTHVMWHRIAPALAERFTLVLPDLRGYGESSCPPSDAAHAAYSKRAMARDVVEVMAAFGFDRFAVVGHDRGGRVAYRLALDAPQQVEKLAVLDIVPTHAMWTGMNARRAYKTYHWLFLAQPAPMPERLIETDPATYLDHTLASWTKTGDLSAFDAQALRAYRRSFSRPQNIHAACEDYRAGYFYDWQADEEDRAAGRRIDAPLLALWGDAGIPSDKVSDPLAVWREWARQVEGAGIDSGHFVCEENPDATLAHLGPFLAPAGA